MQIGIIGLGKMGVNMARRLLKNGHQVTAYNRTREKTLKLSKEGAVAAVDYKDLVCKLNKSRIVWCMLPAGEVTENAIKELAELLEEGDIVIDGANSYYKDAIKRGEFLSDKKIHFIDAGVSGGVWGLKAGYCIMTGGNKLIFEHIKPLLASLCAKGGYLHCGGQGAGHFVKMVHNGIEYALMQSYAEGFELIKKSQYAGDAKLKDISFMWNRGSVIRSWLLELLENIFTEDENLSGVSIEVADSGEGRWTVKEAIDLAVPASAITESLFKRFRSRQKDVYADKLLSALRNKFGGHCK